MPLYSYKGRIFDLPSGLTAEQAKAKIEGALAANPTRLDIPTEEAVDSAPRKTRKIGKAAKAGAANLALTGLALTGGKVKDVDPEGPLANLAYYGSGLLADLPLFAAATALAPTTGGTSLAATVAGSVAKGGVKALASQAVKQAVIGTAKRGAVYGAGDQFLRYPLHAYVKDQPYDPAQHALATATGAVAGGALGVGFEGGYGLLKSPVTKWIASRTANALPPRLGALITERAQAKADLAKLLATKKEAPDALAQRLALEQKISTIEDEIAVDFPKLATQADPVQALRLMEKAGVSAQPTPPPAPILAGRYHGTGRKLEALDDWHYGTQNYYGQGFYTTDSLPIAKGYAKKGGRAPSVFEVTEKRNLKLFDMEAPLDAETKQALSQAPFMEDYPDLIANAKNLRGLYDDIRSELTSDGYSADAIQETFSSFQEALESKGYQGLRHIGGLRTGKAPHDVKIYWQPRSSVDIKAISPEVLNPPPPPSSGLSGLKAAHAERVISDHAAGLITEAEAVKELKALAKGIISPTSYISDISKSTGKAVSARPSSPGKAAKVMSYQVAKDLAQYGYKVDKPTYASSLLRNTERWDAVDLKFGTDMSSLPLKTSAATSKSTNFLADFANEMKGIEKDIARLNMDDDLVRMALKGEVVLPPEETAVVDRLRALTAKAREVGIANGRDIGFLENYAPDRLKAGLSVGAPKALNKKAVAPTEQKMTAEYHKRGKLNEDLMEKSPVTAAKMYASDIARTFYDGVMLDIQKNWAHLQLLGQDKEAAYLLQTFANTTGMGRPAAVRLIASHFLKNGSFDVEAALKAADIKMSTATIDKILNTAGELMMENWIGPNIKTHVLQRMQNYLVGSAEIGFKYVKQGSKLFKNTPEKLKPILERARRDLQVIDDVDLLERGLGGESYKLPFGLETVRKPGKWLLGKFAAVETPNRLKMFLGARQQFVENLDKLDDVLGGMLETQRRYVLNALEKGGIEEAAYQYGLIRSTRTNFLFSAMDRPEILSGKLGRLIPFTSWTTNNWMRYLGDVKQGDYRTLTKRIVYPMAILAIIQGITGFKMPGGHPASGLISLPEIAPFATDPTALGPGAGIYQRSKKLFGKKPTTAGGFHPVEHPSLQSLIVDFVKKSKKESK